MARIMCQFLIEAVILTDSLINIQDQLMKISNASILVFFVQSNQSYH